MYSKLAFAVLFTGVGSQMSKLLNYYIMIAKCWARIVSATQQVQAQLHPGQLVRFLLSSQERL
jgi:hypothetical protein